MGGAETFKGGKNRGEIPPGLGEETPPKSFWAGGVTKTGGGLLKRAPLGRGENFWKKSALSRGGAVIKNTPPRGENSFITKEGSSPQEDQI